MLILIWELFTAVVIADISIPETILYVQNQGI